MNLRRRFFVVVLSLFFAAASPAADERVRHVYDGDTVLLESGERVRYLGIDAPEIDHEGGNNEFLALEARRFNEGLVMGARVRLEYDQERKDRHGRVLAYVFLESGDMVNARLVRRGLAHILSKRPNLRYRQVLLNAQREAMRTGTGIWSRNRGGDESVYTGNKASFLFHRPGCLFGRRISPGNRMEFRRRFDAFWTGYSPCKRCRP